MARIILTPFAFSTGGNTITNNDAAVIPLVIKGASGQTAPLIEIRNSSNTLLSYNLSNGDWVMPNLFNSYAGIGTGYSDYQGGATSLYVRPTATTRSGAVIKGLASQTANLQEWQDSTASILARIDNLGQFVTSTTVYANNIQNNTGYWSFNNNGVGVLTARAATNIPLTLKGAASQSTNLLELQNSSASILSRFDQNANFYNSNRAFIGTQSYTNNTLLVQAVGGTTETTVVIKANSGLTGNLQELQNSSGTILGRFDAFGDLSNNRINLGTAVFGTGIYYGKLNILQEAGGNNIALQGRDNQSVDMMRMRQGSNSIGDFFTLQNFAGTVLGGYNAVGQAYTGSTTPILTASGGTIQSIASGANPLVTMASAHGFSVGDLVTLAGTTGNTYNGTFVVASTPLTTTFTITSALTTGQAGTGGTASDPAQLSVTAKSASTIGVVIRGVASQSNSLQQWQNSAGSVLGQFDPSGYIGISGGFYFFNSKGSFEQAFGGAFLQMAKSTSAPTNPGANSGRMYFRDGTTAGTLKLVVRAGAAGIEETIVDNLSSTGSTAGAQFVGAGGVNTAGTLTSTGLSLSSTTSPILLNSAAGTSGQVLTSAGAGATPTWTTVSGGSFTGGTLTSNLTLAVGTTSLSPFTFQSGTNLTTVTAGANEYDGTVFYQTSSTTPGRALATQQYYYASSSDWFPDFSASGAAKSMLGGATTGITLAAGTTYEFELYTTIQHQYITSTGVTGTYTLTSTTVTGSPTVAFVQNVDYGSNTTNFTTATTLSRVRTTGGVTFSATISSGSRYNFLQAKGVIRVTGTGTVKIYPSLATSQGGASDNVWTVQSGTVFKLTPIGNGTATTVGTWA